MGQRYTIGNDVKWSTLFSAAKIANTNTESVIGQPDSPIYFVHEDTIRGGPGNVYLCKPDEKFLKNSLTK